MRLDQDVTLFCIADAHETTKEHWLNLWCKGYPLSCIVYPSPQNPIANSIQQIQTQMDQTIPPIFIVAYGYGVLVFLAWLSQTNLMTQKNIIGAILVAPPLDDTDQLPPYLNETIHRVCVNFPTVLVASDNDKLCSIEKAQQLAKTLHAQFQNAGEMGHFNTQSHIGTWEKGMLLMQSMLINL